ncbi:TonB-dependent siderophore receptor [Methylobacterium sp. W2]|uniref:TonB-dependent siderophore receptor n=1 Tax=Methylobacterium sp. W2 TaxID=2598107 RepID=UPI001D0C678C|nr:TonB-dependent siderophore receptor [Methylobacterium sp. W2]MCC0808866.1 TonB-dependent siderophore receptor [Methylobacterium sp. W2]
MQITHSKNSKPLHGVVASIALTGVSLATLIVSAAAQEAATSRRGAASSSAQASVQLQELSVEGTGRPGGAGVGGSAVARAVESPTGPVTGYVATRSATATKTNTPLIETPQSITVVGREQIDAQKAQTLTQATQYTAGVYSGTFGADTRVDYFSLRGFIASDYGIYRDGLQVLNYGFGTFKVETFGLERIEVLRGPAAVLFGAGNPGGIINQITKRPTTQPFGYVEVGGGSFGQVYGAFDFGGPADDSGHWFYRLTGFGKQGGTQVDGAPDDRVYIAPALTYRPTGGTSLTFLTSYQRDSTAVTANFLPYYGTVRPNVNGLRIPRSLNVGDPAINTFQREQVFAGYEFEHAIDQTWTIRQNLRYSFSDAFQNSYLNQLGYADPATQTTLSRYQFLTSSKVGIFQVDNQAEARFFDGYFAHDLLLGVDYKRYDLHDNQGTNFAAGYSVPGMSITNPIYGQITGRPSPYLVNADTFQQVGIYAQDQIKLTDRLTLVLGGRQDFAENVVRDRLNPGNSSQRSDEAFSGRAAVIYNFIDGLAPYVSYSTSFQPQIGSDANGRSYVPEYGEQVEAGVKFEPIGYGFFLTAAAFDLVRQNVLQTIPGTFFSAPLGEVRSRGVEVQAVANLAEGLNLVGAFTAYDLQTIKGNADQVGLTPTRIPEVLASVFADYTIPTGDLRGFGFGGGVRYIGRSFADVANTLTVPEYVLFDAQVHYSWDKWRAAVNVTNIADRRYVTSCISGNECFYGDARRVIASLAYKW